MYDDDDGKLPNIPVWPTNVEFTREVKEAEPSFDDRWGRFDRGADPYVPEPDERDSRRDSWQPRQRSDATSSRHHGSSSGRGGMFMLLVAGLGGWYYFAHAGQGMHEYVPVSSDNSSSTGDQTRRPSDAERAPQPARGSDDTPDSPNDGSDAARPALAPADENFVDHGRGWAGLGSAWCDRCYLHLNGRKLGWAKAECERGLELADPDAVQPRASLLYNLGQIEKRAQNLQSARDFFQRSLALRENDEVRAALDSL